MHGSCITQFGLKLGRGRPLVPLPSSNWQTFVAKARGSGRPPLGGHTKRFRLGSPMDAIKNPPRPKAYKMLTSIPYKMH